MVILITTTTTIIIIIIIKPSFTKPYCGKRGSFAMDPIIPSYLWDSDEETEHSTTPKNTKEYHKTMK
jgi:hypothetical protein